MKDAICGQLFFAVAHELGHAMFDIFDVPGFGRQEHAADQFRDLHHASVRRASRRSS